MARRCAGDGPAAARWGWGGVVEAAVERRRRASWRTGRAMAWPNSGGGRAEAAAEETIVVDLSGQMEKHKGTKRGRDYITQP